ncbi:MAG: hypothetical protein J7647_12325 [Cyanobacteria bacterium SBLK]|nr:hypothetical protein [Cyanobacteria bacterium SBLK]
MPEKPFLYIVMPTRGNVSDYWLEQLLNVCGDRDRIKAEWQPTPESMRKKE